MSLATFLETVPIERRDDFRRVWEIVRSSAPKGYVETIGPKFLTLTAEGEWYVALANQKSYMSIYLMPVYVVPALHEKLHAHGRKLKMGKSCINFKRADELPLDVVGEIIAANTPEQWLETVRTIRNALHKST